MRYRNLAILALVVGLIGASHASYTYGNTPAEAETELSALLWPNRPEPAAPRFDQAGRMLTPAALRDKVVVLAFVSADCLVACVVRTRDLDGLARALPARLRDRTAILATGVDSARDDGPAIRDFAKGLGIDAERFRLVTADTAATAAVVAFLRYPAARLPEPPPVVLLFDRRGRIAMNYGADPLDGARLLRDIEATETFADGVGSPERAGIAPP